jgi:hypothetical protein
MMLIKIGNFWVNPDQVTYVCAAPRSPGQTVISFSGTEDNYLTVDPPAEMVVTALNGRAAWVLGRG